MSLSSSFVRETTSFPQGFLPASGLRSSFL